MKPAAGESSAAAAAKETNRDVFDSKGGREDDTLLGWGSRTSGANNMIPSTVARGKKGSKLTGGSGARGGAAAYTEGPLGSGARSRMASYDSASTLGLPRLVCVCGVARFFSEISSRFRGYLLLIGHRLLFPEMYAVVRDTAIDACFILV